MENKSIKISLFLLFSLGCVPKSHLTKVQSELSKSNSELASLQAQCDQASAQYDLQVYLLESDLKEKNERLSKFNQIDGNGRLRSNVWKVEKDKPLNGNESWMK